MASILSSRYQPSPRMHHYAGQVRGKSYMWGGLTLPGDKDRLKSTMNIFDPYLETWQEQHTRGVPPPHGVHNGASVSCSNSLYSFAGYDGNSWHNSLHVLDTDVLEWKNISNPTDCPMPKSGCGMVFYGKHNLATFGGYGPLTHSIQTVSSSCSDSDQMEWTNELHTFDVTEGKWSSPPTTGPRPPPCSSFTFTMVNEHTAVMFGGRAKSGVMNAVYIIDFRLMEWTKVERPKGAPWPEGRVYHAACCLSYGEDQPVLLITGGIDEDHEVLGDAWLFDVHSRRWKKLTLPDGTQPRWGHTLTAFRMDETRINATTFGGCPSSGDLHRSYDDDPKLSDTTVLEFAHLESPSGHTPFSELWHLVCVADTSLLGTPKRIRELEKLKESKTAKERESTLQTLKQQLSTKVELLARKDELLAARDHRLHLKEKKIATLQEEVTSAQRQARSYLARAIRAEQKADQGTVHEQQLPQAIATLEEQIRMKDEASVAAQQQFDQTRVALEHQILVRDQTNADLQQTYDQMRATLENQIEENERARVSIEQEYHLMKWKLKHQLREEEQIRMTLELQLLEKDRARVALEAEIQAKIQEKQELEQQLHRKDERITTVQQSQSGQMSAVSKSQEKANQDPGMSGDLVKPSKVGSWPWVGASVVPYAPTNLNTPVEVAEMQKVGDDAQVISQEGVAFAEQSLQTRNDEARDEFGQATDQTIQDRTMRTMQFQLHEEEPGRVHQRLEKEQAKMALEAQIGAKDQEKRELEQQLLRKDEHIRTLQSEQMSKSQEKATQDPGISGDPSKVDGWVGASIVPTSQNAAVEGAEMQKVIAQQPVKIVGPSQGGNMMPVTSLPIVHLRGTHVIAQKTFTVTQEAQNLQFQGYGFKLHVPKGSLPAEVSETKLNVQVSLSGQFQMPPDCELISAVYWVYCPHKFTKPLILEIQHCAVLSSAQQCSQLSFVSTKCTQKELPYVFKVRDGGVFSDHSSYGSLSLTHFSGVGIIQRIFGVSDEQYCGQVFTSRGINDCTVYFVITKSLDAHCTVMKESCSTEWHARFDMDMSIEFDSEVIELSIPKSGESGWEITPRYDPTIKKRDVDHFGHGRVIPKCELLLQWPHADKPQVSLVHNIKLIGAKDRSFLTLFIRDAAAGSPIASPVTTEGPSPSRGNAVFSHRGTQVATNSLQLKVLAEALYNKVADKWKMIGVLIDIPRGTLASIAEKYQRDPNPCLLEMLEVWLERIHPPASWATIIDAVEFVGEEKLAEKLRVKYLK